MHEELLAGYEARLGLLETLSSKLERETLDALEGLPHIDRVYYRVKSARSFLEKAVDPNNKPPYGDPLVEVEDQIAGRILVFFLGDICGVISRLQGTLTTVESQRRRPEKDEEFGYESHHLICVIPPQVKPKEWEAREDLPKTFELQIRTLFMHAWAEPQHDLEYKASQDLPRELRRELFWVAASAWGADQALERVRQQLRGRQRNRR